MKPVTRWKFEADSDPDTHGRVYLISDNEPPVFRGFYSINPNDSAEAWIRLEGCNNAQIVRLD